MEISINDDYACASTSEDDPFKLTFYYGYEYIYPPTKEWCFMVWKEGQLVKKLTTSDLQQACKNNLDSPEKFLLQGMMMYFLQSL